jgi:hypothetical protein
MNCCGRKCNRCSKTRPTECKFYRDAPLYGSLLILFRFLWASLVLEIVLNDCCTPNEAKNAITKLPTDLEKLYLSCLARKRGNEPLCNPMSIKIICAAPKPIRAMAFCQLLALNMTTGEVASGDVMSPDVAIQHGVGLITLDQTEQLILPAHDSVRVFIFSKAAFTAMQKLSTTFQTPMLETVDHDHFAFSDSIGMTVGNPSRTSEHEMQTTTYLGNACLMHIQHKASRLLTVHSSQQLPVVPKVTADMPAWIRRPIQMFWPDTPDQKTVKVNIPFRSQRAPEQRDEFFQYARKNWILCNRHLSFSNSMPSKKQLQLFSSIATERNESWKLHPWPSQTTSRTQHLAGMFAYSVANGLVPLLELALQHTDSLPRGIFTGLLPNHGFLPALHVACSLGHHTLLEKLSSVCDLSTTCQKSRTALHYAAESGHEMCFMYFHQRDPRYHYLLDQGDSERRTALHLALLNGHEDLALCLVGEFGKADAHLKDSRGTSPVDLALDEGFGNFIVKTHSKHELAELLEAKPQEESPLVSAAGAGRTRRAHVLCWLMDFHTKEEAGPSLQHASTRGMFCWQFKIALHAAVDAGHADVVLVLLESDLFVQAMSMHGPGQCFPFASAISGYYHRYSSSLQTAASIVKMLTTALTSWSHKDPTEQAPGVHTRYIYQTSDILAVSLCAAAEIGQAESVRQVLDLWRRENSASTTDDESRQPGHITLYHLKNRGVHRKTLDKLGIDPCARSTPVLLAAIRQHEDILCLLLPDYDAVRIKNLMAQAQGIELKEPPKVSLKY